MQNNSDKFEDYFRHLKRLSLSGLIYHRLYKLPLLYFILRRFGSRQIEVGSGIGNGVLGAFSSKMIGIDINPHAVEYCQRRGFNARLINEDGTYPFKNGKNV